MKIAVLQNACQILLPFDENRTGKKKQDKKVSQSLETLHKKWNFPLSISVVNVSKSTENYRSVYICYWNPS